MIRGPFKDKEDGTLDVPLEPPYLTPIFKGERVALRVSAEDDQKVTPGHGYKGTITDLDDDRRYAVFGMPCKAACYCDAELFPLPKEEP
jgi:hypothetical protein